MEELGGPGVHARNGVCQLVAADEDAATEAARRLLGYLPQPDRRPCSDAALPRARERRPGRRRCPPSRGGSTTSATWSERICRRRLGRRALGGRWAREHGHSLGPDRGTAGRRDRQPAAADRRRDRRRGGGEGGRLRRRSATASGCRSWSSSTPRASCRARRQEGAGVIRHGASLLRAFAGARVPKVTVVTAQGLRRRRDHDELEGPRRGSRLRLARRRDRDHGRAPGRRRGPSSPPRRGRRGVGRASRAALRAVRGRAPDRATAAATSGFVDAIIEPGDTRVRLAQALATIGGDGG